MHLAHITALTALLHAGSALSTLAAAAPLPNTNGPITELTERDAPKVSDLTLPVPILFCILRYNIKYNGGKRASEAFQEKALRYCQVKYLQGVGIDDVPLPSPPAKRDVELSEQEFPIKSLGAVHCMLQYNKNTNDGKEMSEAQEKEALQQCQLSALVPLGKDDVQPIANRQAALPPNIPKAIQDCMDKKWVLQMMTGGGGMTLDQQNDAYLECWAEHPGGEKEKRDAKPVKRDIDLQPRYVPGREEECLGGDEGYKLCIRPKDPPSKRQANLPPVIPEPILQCMRDDYGYGEKDLTLDEQDDAYLACWKANPPA